MTELLSQSSGSVRFINKLFRSVLWSDSLKTSGSKESSIYTSDITTSLGNRNSLLCKPSFPSYSDSSWIHHFWVLHCADITISTCIMLQNACPLTCMQFFLFFFLIVYLTSLTRLLLVGGTLHFTLWRTLIDSSAQLFCPVVNRLSLCCSEWLQRSVFGPRRRWRPRYGAVSDPAVCLRYRVRHQRVGLPDECGELVAKQLPRWHLFTDLNSFKQISIHKSIK